jgi:hypothetical protein
MKKATKKEILQMALTMENKYFDLVWYARRTDEDYKTIPLAREAMDRIDEQYPEEVFDLCNDESNWTHGFNSGCLAAFRMILTMSEFGVEEAVEEFPLLDS